MSLNHPPTSLHKLLEAWAPKQRWFAQLATQKPVLSNVELIPLSGTLFDGALFAEADKPALLLALLDFADGRRFQVPLLLSADSTMQIQTDAEGGCIGPVNTADFPTSNFAIEPENSIGSELYLFDATALELGRKALGSFFFATDNPVAKLELSSAEQLHQDFSELGTTSRISAEQSNTSLVFHSRSGRSYILKLFRQISAGVNPDIQIHAALQAEGNSHIASYFGALQLVPDTDAVEKPLCLGLLTKFFPNAKDAWNAAIQAARTNTDFTTSAFALGTSLAEIHQDLKTALESASAGTELIAGAEKIMRERLADAIKLEPQINVFAAEILEIYAGIKTASWPDFQRIHGDLHLGQILETADNGWIFLDFEGEPLRPLKQRLQIDSPLRDLAGILRSFDYAAGFVKLNFNADASQWATAARDACIAGYLQASGSEQLNLAVLNAFELDKAVYELVYELANRPDWAEIPRQAINRILHG